MSCYDCANRQCNKIEKGEINRNIYRYGCFVNKHIVGWVYKDSELKNMGCSSYEPQKQMSLFDDEE